MNSIPKLTEDLEVLEKYLQVKIAQRDWHAVWDVAVDIHNTETKIRLLREVNGLTEF